MIVGLPRGLRALQASYVCYFHACKIKLHVITSLLLVIFALPSHAILYAPSEDADGSFLVTWDLDADPQCRTSSSAPMYQLTERRSGSVINTYDYYEENKQHQIISGRSPGHYSYTMRRWKCGSSGSGGGTFSQTVPLNVEVTAGGDEGTAVFGLKGPSRANARGFTIEWEPTSSNSRKYRLIENVYGAQPSSTTVFSDIGSRQSYYRNFPLEGHIYQYTLCQMFNGRCGLSASIEVEVLDEDVVNIVRPADAVGSTPYRADVDYKGNASINIPIKVLPGDNGLEPVLSLTYNSGGSAHTSPFGKADGLFEHGWDISGFSKISRCRKGDEDEDVEDNILAGPVDPTARPRIQYNTTDSLCIDEQKLVLVGGTHFSPGAVYRTYIESFKRIQIKSGSGGIWFEVRHPDGRISEYGRTTATRYKQHSSTPDLTWGLESVRDAFGNTMRYSYLKAETHNTNPVTSNTIQNYTRRPEETATHLFPRSIVYPGGRIEIRTRGYNPAIEIMGSSGGAHRTYFLGFDGGQTHLDFVQECGHFSNSCLMPIRFTYGSRGSNSSMPSASYDKIIRVVDGVGARTEFKYHEVAHQCNRHTIDDGPEFDVNDPDARLHLYREDVSFNVFPDILLYSFDNNDVPSKSPAGKTDSGMYCRIRENTGNVNNAGISVSRISRSDGAGGINHWDYRYGDPGFNDAFGRGFLGYSSVRVIDDQTDTATYTQYHLQDVLAGMVQGEKVYSQRVEHGQGNTAVPLSSKTVRHDIYQIRHGNGAITYYPYTKKEDLREYEGSTARAVTFVDHLYFFNSAGYPVTKRITTTVGDAVTDSTDIIRTDIVDYRTSTIPSTRVQSVERAIINYRNFTSANDWRIMFESSNMVDSYNGNIGGSGVDRKSQRVDMSPWQNTFSTGVKTIFPGDSQLQLRTETTYDTIGNMTSSTISGQNIHTRTTRYEDYRNGIVPIHVYNALDHEITNGRWDPAYRRPTVTSDPNGRTTSETLDGFERSVGKVDSDGNETRVEYIDCDDVTCCTDEACSAQGAVASYMKVITSEIGPTVKQVFDVNNRIIRTYAEGFNTGEWYKTVMHYDKRGLMTRRSLPYVNLSDRVFTEYEYDNARQRKILERRPDGSTTEWRYGVEYISGRPHLRMITIDTVEDAFGTFLKTRAKVSFTNAVGQIVRSVDGYTASHAFTSLGAMDSSKTVTTTYAYDGAGNLSRASVSGQSDGTTVTTTRFDNAGNRIELNGPNVGQIMRKYSALGEVIESRDAEGRITTYGYDKLGRIEYKVAGSDVYRYEYDKAEGLGFPSRTTHNHDSYTANYSYLDGRITSMTETINIDDSIVSGLNRTEVGTTRFTYDHRGRVAVTEYASGMAVRNVYKSNGYLGSIINDDTFATLYQVESMGVYGVDQVRYGNGAQAYYRYHKDTGFMKEIDHRNSGNLALHYQKYRWHSNGNMQERSHSRGNNTGTTHRETFAYDAHDRLTRTQIFNGGSLRRTLSYNYNRLGNILSKSSTNSSDDRVTGYRYGTRNSGCSYTPGPHAVSQANINGVTNTLCYDESGFITRYTTSSGPDKHLKYNHMGQPINITVGASLTDNTPDARDVFLYGPEDQRYFKHTRYKEGTRVRQEHTYYFSDGTERTVYDHLGENRETNKTYASNDVQLIRRTDRFGTRRDEMQYLHRDHLGSVVAISNHGAGRNTPQHAMAFEPFGSRRKADWTGKLSASETNALMSETSTNTTHGFTGHEHLDRTGFIHMNGRVYDPVLGRFLTPDPLVQSPTLSQSWNRYSYVWNNPLRSTDPSGYSGDDVNNRDGASQAEANARHLNGNEDKEDQTNENGTDSNSEKSGDIEVTQQKGQDSEGTSETTKKDDAKDSKDADKIDTTGFTKKEIRRLKKALKRAKEKLEKMKKLIEKAKNGNKSARRRLEKYFGEGVLDNLGELGSTVDKISNALNTSVIVRGDQATIDANTDPNTQLAPGGWADLGGLAIINVNPEYLDGNADLMAGILVHEAVHVSGIRGHVPYIGGPKGLAYGSTAALGLAKQKGYKFTRNNPSNYGCLAVTNAPVC